MSADEIPDDAVEELLRLGTDCLDGTIQLALASDQRGVTLGAFFGAGAVALLAAAGAAAPGGGALPAPFLVTAALLFFAAVLCAWSARPSNFYVGGYEPDLLAESAADLTWMKRHVISDVQRRVTANRRALRLAGSYTSCGMIVAAIAPFIGIAAYFAF
jgi:hypothetical protein